MPAIARWKDNAVVRTRFAPSPTGYLHIGGVRTALFNWLFARRHGGRFILRIDDTDRQRNLTEALEPILNGFRWLGIDWDEGVEVGGDFGPYFQSQRQHLYHAAVQALLDSGLAYRDYATAEELQAEREAAQAGKQRFIYSRRWMAETEQQRQAYEGAGRQGAVRLKMPREGQCRFDDLIRGEMAFDWALEQDHVIQRADGSCLYHLASSVDDHEMRISHVIRAEEHLSNTPRQIFILQGLGYDLPQFAHLPVVSEPGGKAKLSKRKLDKYLKNGEFAKIYEHGRAIAEAISLETSAESFNPVIVEFYEKVGYLPEAIVNYLLLLGWALDDKTEYFTRPEMVRDFSLERVNSAPASFDPQKLSAFEEHYMQLLPVERKTELVRPYLQRAGLDDHLGLPDVIAAAGDRIKVAGDILDYSGFFMADDLLPYDDSAFDKRIRKPEDAAELLAKFRQRLAAAAQFDAASLEVLLQEFITSESIKIGRIIHAMRVAVTGQAVGFGIFESLAILGRERCLARIDRALKRLQETIVSEGT
jgi:glutamyl-tRNA synthetase